MVEYRVTACFVNLDNDSQIIGERPQLRDQLPDSHAFNCLGSGSVGEEPQTGGDRRMVEELRRQRDYAVPPDSAQMSSNSSQESLEGVRFPHVSSRPQPHPTLDGGFVAPCRQEDDRDGGGLEVLV